jgi:hypothetical protein
MTGNIDGNSDKRKKEMNKETSDYSDYSDYFYHQNNRAPKGVLNSARQSGHVNRKVSLKVVYNEKKTL